MKKETFLAILFLSLVALFSCVPPESVAPAVFGGKKYDSARAIVRTKTGYAMAGMTDSFGLGGIDVYLVAVDKNGRLKFQQSYGGKGDDAAYALTMTSDGCYALAGYTTSYGAGKKDMYIILTGKNGEYKKSTAFGGPNQDEAKSICQAENGQFLIAGSTASYGNGNFDGYLIMTDSKGDCVWSRTTGGEMNDMFNAVIPAGGGRYLAVGSSNSGTKGFHDMYAVLVDEVGAVIWEKTYGGELMDSGYAAVSTSDGGFLIVGEKSSKISANDIWLVRTDKDGTVLWEQLYGGARIDYASSVVAAPDGGFIIAGLTESRGNGMSDMIVFKTDKLGRIVWEKLFGGRHDEYAGGITTGHNGGYAVCGWTKSYGSGDYDVVFMKLNEAGK